MIVKPYAFDNHYYYESACFAFIDALGNVPPKPAGMDRILRFNQGRALEPRS